MTNANLKPLFMVEEREVAALVRKRTSRIDHGKARGFRWVRFEIGGISIYAEEKYARWFSVDVAAAHYQVIKGDAQIVLDHINRGCPLVSANDDKSADLISGDDETDAMLAELD